jgi:hypothetical protein
MNKNELIDQLLRINEENIQDAVSLRNLKSEILHLRPGEGKWNVLECVEHLLQYGDYYIPEIKAKLQSASPSSTNEYKSSWLGNYFADVVSPLGDNKRAKKMKTLRKTNPINFSPRPQAMDLFIQQQEALKNQLVQSRNYDIEKIKTGISITPWLKLRLGDTFRVVIMHNKRHLIQAKRAAGVIS